MSAATGSRYRFGSFVLDEGSQQLLRGVELIHLTPKSFDLLSLLVRNPETDFSKADLLAEVWPNVLVSEGVVKVSIAEIRRALAETAARPIHLHTVSRRGYRFAGPVVRVEGSEPAGSGPLAWVAERSESPFVGREDEMRVFTLH